MTRYVTAPDSARVARMVAQLEPLVAAQAASDPLAALNAQGVPPDLDHEQLVTEREAVLTTALPFLGGWMGRSVGRQTS